MTTLTDKQVKELTAFINSRIEEFWADLPALSPGMVRLIEGLIDEWWQEQDAEEYREMRAARDGDRQESIDTYALSDAYSFGYERGRQAMRRELLGDQVDEGRLVTNSAPEPEPEGGVDYAGKIEDLIDPPLDEPLLALHSPIGAGRVPHPDIARANVAAMLAQGNGDHGFDLTPRLYRKHKDDRRGKNGNVLPTREEMVAMVQKIAMGGVMPTMAQFDVAKPGNWASASAQLMRLNMSWGELRVEAGLAPNPRSPESR